MGYKTKVFKSVGWVSAFKVLSRLASFLKIAVIARILTPAQFGVFGIASLLLAFLEIITETGINIILIQESNDIKKYINSAWVVSIFRGFFLCFMIIILSPFIVYFFNSPNAQSIILLISLVPLIKGFINPAIIRFQKELKFKYEFIFRSSVFLSDVFFTVVFVFLTHSTYGLILGLISGALLEVFLSFIFVRPLPKFSFDRNYINQIFHKGKWVTAFSIFGYFGDQGDNIVVGKLLGTQGLGIYQMIFKISILPLSEISDSINRVVFPVYAKIEKDRKRLKKAFVKTTFFISLLTFSLGLIIFIYPKEIILMILGNNWLTGSAALRILSIYGIIRSINGSVTALFFAIKKQSYVTVMSFVRLVVLAVIILPLVLSYGIIGAAYAALFSAIFEIIIVIYFLQKVFKVKK